MKSAPDSTPPMFEGVARSHRIRDLAAVALCLALIGGFVAHATTPVRASPPPAATMIASTVQPACPCPDSQLR